MLIDEIKSYSDKEIANHSKKFFKTEKGEYGYGDKFLGIRVPILRELAKKHKNISTKDAENLLKNEYHEIRLLALFILIYHFKKEPEKIYKIYLNNIKSINNWDLVDSSSYKIVGEYLLNREKEPLYKLVKSKNLWERRVAIISTFQFIKNNQYKDTIKLSKILLNDKEDLIHKATGWMLREVGKREKDILIEFLEKNSQKMARTMLRYSIEKLSKEEKKYFMTKEV